ncbi:unnamed protein product [Boreogadus saida]
MSAPVARLSGWGPGGPLPPSRPAPPGPALEGPGGTAGPAGRRGPGEGGDGRGQEDGRGEGQQDDAAEKGEEPALNTAAVRPHPPPGLGGRERVSLLCILKQFSGNLSESCSRPTDTSPEKTNTGGGLAREVYCQRDSHTQGGQENGPKGNSMAAVMRP